MPYAMGTLNSCGMGIGYEVEDTRLKRAATIMSLPH